MRIISIGIRTGSFSPTGPVWSSPRIAVVENFVGLSPRHMLYSLLPEKYFKKIIIS